MFKVIFYQTKQGNQPVLDYINKLASKNGKDSRINLKKIQDYINALKLHGTRIGEPVVKHLAGEIWELRPLKNRILFAGVVGDTFILLHHFTKKTQKTPPQELAQAQKNLADYLERSGL